MQRPTRIALGAVALSATIVPAALFALPATAGKVKTHAAPVVLPTTATYSYSATLSGLPGSSQPVSVNGTIAADFTAGQVEVTATLPQAIGPIGPGTVTLIEAGQTIYVNAPGLSTFTGGHPWVSITEPATLKALGHLDAKATPAQIVGNVPAVIAAVTSKPAGHPIATVTSTSTSGSSTTTNLLVHLPQLHRHTPAAAGTSTLPTSIPISVTDNASGQLLSASTSITVGSMTLSASLTSTGYNVPVSISVPQSSQVLAIPTSTLQMLGSLIHAGSTDSFAHVAASDVAGLARTGFHDMAAKIGI